LLCLEFVGCLNFMFGKEDFELFFPSMVPIVPSFSRNLC
jgi:hypothetical protein